MSRRVVFLLGAVALLSPRPAAGQWWVPDLFDLAAAWGEEERTMDLGGGWTYWKVTAAGGLAFVEHGLEPPYEWNEDKTKIFDPSTNPPQQVDPRDGRTSPFLRVWARLEYQPDWWGLTAMWDPRKHLAGGAFAAVTVLDGPAGGAQPAPDRVQAQGEVRWVETLGWLIAVRLRFR